MLRRLCRTGQGDSSSLARYVDQCELLTELSATVSLARARHEYILSSLSTKPVTIHHSQLLVVWDGARECILYPACHTLPFLNSIRCLYYLFSLRRAPGASCTCGREQQNLLPAFVSVRPSAFSSAFSYVSKERKCHLDFFFIPLFKRKKERCIHSICSNFLRVLCVTEASLSKPTPPPQKLQQWQRWQQQQQQQQHKRQFISRPNQRRDTCFGFYPQGTAVSPYPPISCLDKWQRETQKQQQQPDFDWRCRISPQKLFRRLGGSYALGIGYPS